MKKFNNIVILVAALLVISFAAFSASKNYQPTIDFDTVLTPGVYSSDTTSSAFDVADYKGAIIAIQVASGTFSGTNNVIFELEHSDTTTANDFTDVAAGDVKGVTLGSNGAIYSLTAATGGNVEEYCAYIGNKKYVRVILNASGTISATSSVALIKTDPYIAQ